MNGWMTGIKRLSICRYSTGLQTYTLNVMNVKDFAGNTSKDFIFTPDFISNIWTASGKQYLAGQLNTGDAVYMDRNYTLATIPQKYQGLTWVKTHMDDKSGTANPFLTYEISVEAEIYVGFSIPAPAWVVSEGWKLTGNEIIIPILGTDIPYTLYSKPIRPMPRSAWKRMKTPKTVGCTLF